jgi:hypothetical protein
MRLVMALRNTATGQMTGTLSRTVTGPVTMMDFMAVMGFMMTADLITVTDVGESFDLNEDDTSTERVMSIDPYIDYYHLI